MDNRTDLTYLTWSISRSSTGTAGSFLKSYEIVNGVKYYYKVSNFDTIRGIYGHESINEIVAQNVAEILGIPHLKYELVHADIKVNDKIYETWLTRSRDFKEVGEHKLTFETYYEMLSEEEEIWHFIERQGMQTYFYQLFLLDYLIRNRDRHGANIEVLEKNGCYRIASVFDNGLSFCFSCYDDGQAMKQFDRKKDGPVNNYVGSRSLSENLRKVPKEMLSCVRKEDFTKEAVFKDLQECQKAVPEEYWDSVYEMLLERIDFIETICD